MDTSWRDLAEYLLWLKALDSREGGNPVPLQNQNRMPTCMLMSSQTTMPTTIP
jgi:hypothetical protein